MKSSQHFFSVPYAFSQMVVLFKEQIIFIKRQEYFLNPHHILLKRRSAVDQQYNVNIMMNN